MSPRATPPTHVPGGNELTCPWCRSKVIHKVADLYTCASLATFRVALDGDQCVALVETSADDRHPQDDSRPVL